MMARIQNRYYYVPFTEVEATEEMLVRIVPAFIIIWLMLAQGRGSWREVLVTRQVYYYYNMSVEDFIVHARL